MPRYRINARLLMLFGVLASLAYGSMVNGTEPETGQTPVFRIWTSDDGKYTTRAELIAFDSGKVTLRKQNGIHARVTITKLSKADQKYVMDTTGWGRVWLASDGQRKFLADLVQRSGDTVTLERLDGSKVIIPLAAFSKADRAYVEARTTHETVATTSTTLQGKVVGIIDGDTLTILIDHKPQKVRLNGIDAPEKGQAFGTTAKELLSKLCFGQRATAINHGKDKYGRFLADVLVDGVQVNRAMVQAGLAWHYKRFSRDRDLADLQSAAMIAKKGLWSEPHSVAPWEWRRWGPAERRS